MQLLDWYLNAFGLALFAAQAALLAFAGTLWAGAKLQRALDAYYQRKAQLKRLQR